MTYVADTSAWTIAGRSEELHGWFGTFVIRREVVMTDMVAFELLRSTRNIDEFQQRRLDLTALPHATIDGPVWSRALDVYEALAARGGSHHRQVPYADLLIAAAAERAGCTVLHYDADFDVISSITGQPTEWIAPRGSL